MHILKLHKGDFDRIRAHCNRTGGKGSKSYSDPEKRALNEYLEFVSDKDFEAFRARKTRKNGVLGFDCVVTLPKDYKGDSKLFLGMASDSVSSFFQPLGAVPFGCYFHFDETTPHVHCLFLCEKTAKSMISPTNLSRLHPFVKSDLEEWGIDTTNFLTGEYSKLSMTDYKAKKQAEKLTLKQVQEVFLSLGVSSDIVNSGLKKLERKENGQDVVNCHARADSALTVAPDGTAVNGRF